MVGPRRRDAGRGGEHFDTGGRVTGWIGLVASIGMIATWFAALGDPLPLWVLFGSVFTGLLFWAAFLRPAVSATEDTLFLRNMLEDVEIPLAAVEEHAVRQVLAVRAGSKRYVSTGVSRSSRDARASNRAGGRAGGRARGSDQASVRAGGTARLVDPADFVEARLTDLTTRARERARVERWSDEQLALAAGVRRSPSWLVIIPLAASFAATVLSVVLA
jgi:hypothetical protein